MTPALKTYREWLYDTRREHSEEALAIWLAAWSYCERWNRKG